MGRVRRELEPLNNQILNHPLIREAEDGKLGMNTIRAFVINQWYIINHDLRSLAIGLSRSRTVEELEFFKTLLDGDYVALHELMKLMRELGIEVKDPVTLEVMPEAIQYTHYLSWLANYAATREFALVITVNVPVWGSNVTRLGNALRSRYGIREVGFFDVFKGPYTELEDSAVRIAGDLDGESAVRVMNMARIIQAYEKAFWDAVYSVR
ncbi:MAG: TenA family transcriptional regulator [Vulcanisaeta sp.]|nr:TenA family transcriptional regulator [Vulcanisaeta sp.]